MVLSLSLLPTRSRRREYTDQLRLPRTWLLSSQWRPNVSFQHKRHCSWRRKSPVQVDMSTRSLGSGLWTRLRAPCMYLRLAGGSWRAKCRAASSPSHCLCFVQRGCGRSECRTTLCLYTSITTVALAIALLRGSQTAAVRASGPAPQIAHAATAPQPQRPPPAAGKSACR